MPYIKDLDECQKAVEQDPASAEARLDLAAALVPYGRIEEAASEAREAVRLRPDWADAYISAGFSELLLERFAEARDTFESAVRIDGGQSLARYGLARAHLFLGDYERAREQLDVVESAGDLPPNLVADLRAGVEAVGGGAREPSPRPPDD
jgi:tetratricopeptide (TPR) repeat protein